MQRIVFAICCLLGVSNGRRTQYLGGQLQSLLLREHQLTNHQGNADGKVDLQASPGNLVLAVDPANAFNPSAPARRSAATNPSFASSRHLVMHGVHHASQTSFVPEQAGGDEAKVERGSVQKVVAPATSHQASVLQRGTDPLMSETDTASQAMESKEPRETERDSLRWKAAFGVVRWALLLTISAAFTSWRPCSSNPEEGCNVLYDLSEEDRDYFESREIRESKREIFLARGWGSVSLVLGTALSLIVANSQFGPAYVSFWNMPVGFGPAAWHLRMPLVDWVNEAIMAFFFFLVGMEIKREFIFGALASLRKALLPCIAALGGMIVPAVFYCIVQKITGNPLTGWAIPMATDIAFAMGVYNLFRTRLPAGCAAFLLTLATVDDLGAIAVIAVAFAKNVNPFWLLGAGFFGLVLEYLRRFRVRTSWKYMAAGVSLWYSLLRSGVNADVAGVVAGFAIPAVPAPRYTKAPQILPNLLDHFIHFWVGWANFLIMPLFAIANTAVPLTASGAMIAKSPVAKGIMAGLLLGKPVGIAGVSWLSLKLGWTQWPTGMKPIHLAICGLLGGIAFTMSLFLIEQSLVGPPVMFAKLAVIGGSSLAAVIAIVLMAFQRKPEEPQPSNS